MTICNQKMRKSSKLNYAKKKRRKAINEKMTK